MTWQQAAWLAVACIALAVVTRPFRPTPDAPLRTRVLWGTRSVLREVGIIAGLYALWQWVFALTVTETAGALDHARSIHRFELAIGLPDEVTVQRLTMRSTTVIEALNTFYAYVHVPAMGIMLVWLFFRHRERYPRVRNVLALATGACLVIQSVPVAPPRFLPELGFVDTGLRFGQSVYGAGGSGISNQLAAMPSVHVCWSTLVAAAVVTASTSTWRWLVIAHPVVTLWAVVATGNHWWADGIVAVMLLGAALGIVLAGEAAAARFGPDAPEPDHPQGDRAPEIAGVISLRGSG